MMSFWRYGDQRGEQYSSLLRTRLLKRVMGSSFSCDLKVRNIQPENREALVTLSWDVTGQFRSLSIVTPRSVTEEEEVRGTPVVVV